MITAKTVRSKWFTLWWCPVSIKITSDVIIQSQIRPVPLSELMKIISPLKKSQKYFPVWSKIFPCQYVYGCGCWQAAGAGLSGNVIVCSVMWQELFIQHCYFTCIWAALSNKTTLSHHMLRGFIRWKVMVLVIERTHPQNVLSWHNGTLSSFCSFHIPSDICILDICILEDLLCLVTRGKKDITT